MKEEIARLDFEEKFVESCPIRYQNLLQMFLLLLLFLASLGFEFRTSCF
jgi:hypothetical protein